VPSEGDPQPLTAASAESLLRQSPPEVIVLPRELADNGAGYYSDSVISVVKELRADGIDADFAHDQHSRSWIGEKSATQYLLEFAIGIASTAGWAAVCALLSRNESATPMQAKVARCTQSKTETRWEWLEFTGTSKQIAAQMRELEPPDSHGS
jgi:hypothetical protein